MDGGRVDARAGKPCRAGIDHRRRTAKIDVAVAGPEDFGPEQRRDVTRRSGPSSAPFDDTEFRGQVESPAGVAVERFQREQLGRAVGAV